MAVPLSTLFLSRTGSHETAGADDTLEATLRAYLKAARLQCPEVSVPDADLVVYLADRADRGKLPDGAHAGDVALACACVQGVSGAIEAFRQRFGGVIARVLSRRHAPADMADDATQVVYERLLVAPPGGTAKVAEYKGSGPLRSWVATATARALLMIRRASARRREEPDNAGTALEGVTDQDPELLYMKQRYRAELENALRVALDRLADRERTLLRLHLTERMSIDQLGVMYRVNRATAARWLAAARRSVRDGAREELRARLGLSPSEWNSVAALVRSEIDISVARHLA